MGEIHRFLWKTLSVRLFCYKAILSLSEQIPELTIQLNCMTYLAHDWERRRPSPSLTSPSWAPSGSKKFSPSGQVSATDLAVTSSLRPLALGSFLTCYSLTLKYV
jgi:hypothetical protein